MRTTVDLPAAVHRRARELARSRHQSLSSVIAELTARALAEIEDEPLVVRTDKTSGFPVVSIGRRVTSEDVAAALDDE